MCFKMISELCKYRIVDPYTWQYWHLCTQLYFSEACIIQEITKWLTVEYKICQYYQYCAANIVQAFTVPCMLYIGIGMKPAWSADIEAE
jgi:hypothetical protein